MINNIENPNDTISASEKKKKNIKILIISVIVFIALIVIGLLVYFLALKPKQDITPQVVSPITNGNIEQNDNLLKESPEINTDEQTPSNTNGAFDIIKEDENTVEPIADENGNLILPNDEDIVTDEESFFPEENVVVTDTFNLFVTDRDGDGLSDEEELLLGTDPDNSDTDNDGLFDLEEIKIYQTDPLDRDTDGDGFEDYAEIRAGFDPLGQGKLPEPENFEKK